MFKTIEWGGVSQIETVNVERTRLHLFASWIAFGYRVQSSSTLQSRITLKLIDILM